MGRQCAVPRQNAIDVLLRYMSYFSNPSMPPYSSEVWKDLSKECDGAWSHLSWWVNVTEDRRKILTQARQAAGVNATEIVKETITKSSSCAECDFSFHRSDSEGEMGESTFHLVLTQEKWNKIKPVDCDHDHEKRQSHTLRAGFWSNEIADEFYKQHGLPCAYSFRRAEINISLRRKYYLKIDGKCRSKKCGNYFHGYLDVEPTLVDKRIVIRVRTRNTSREVHEDVRRYLNAAKRREFGKQSHAEGATNMLKRLRRENMERGDTEGPNFPRADVLRHAQYEYVDRQLGIRTTNDDLVQKIYQLQFEKPFLGSINAVGYNPVYIFYGLPLQNTLFKNYNKIMGDRSIVCIDGTGSLVRKVVRELGLQSGHIFLHTIVINFDNKIGSVFQMLSESQDAETFTFWLKRWLNIVNVKPKQSITDYSRALLTDGILQRQFSDIKYEIFSLDVWQ
uniref:NOF_0 protein n=1 Tax=Fopius arisanus TaxID=64838 RepID=A0A0C9RRN0_9HYME